MCELIELLAEGNRLAWFFLGISLAPTTLIWVLLRRRNAHRPKRTWKVSEHWNDATVEDDVFWLIEDEF